jgi:hypothetical protein
MRSRPVRSLRLLGRVCATLFVLSSAFPVTAAVLNAPQPPRWLGVADVVVAALLFGVAATLSVRARPAVTDYHRLAAFQAGQAVAGLIPLLLAVYFLVGQRVNWTVLVIGLGWRAWLLLYTLPALAAATSPRAPPNES